MEMKVLSNFCLKNDDVKKKRASTEKNPQNDFLYVVSPLWGSSDKSGNKKKTITKKKQATDEQNQRKDEQTESWNLAIENQKNDNN